MEIDENIEKLPILMTAIGGFFTIALMGIGNIFKWKVFIEMSSNAAWWTVGFAMCSYFFMETKRENEICEILYSEGEDEEC